MRTNIRRIVFPVKLGSCEATTPANGATSQGRESTCIRLLITLKFSLDVQPVASPCARSGTYAISLTTS